MPWNLGPGVVEFPGGARIYARSLRRDGVPVPEPDWGLYLGGSDGPITSWPQRTVVWPDFWVPSDPADAHDAFEEALSLARRGLCVEIACGGGRGRTGTALACIAQLCGVPAGESVAWVRERYDRRAVEGPFQKRFVKRFAATA